MASQMTEGQARTYEQAMADLQRARDRAVGGYDLGEIVKVVRGRKVPIGTVGTVAWKGKNTYNGRPRLGLDLDTGERVFTDGVNCEPI